MKVALLVIDTVLLRLFPLPFHSLLNMILQCLDFLHKVAHNLHAKFLDTFKKW